MSVHYTRNFGERVEVVDMCTVAWDERMGSQLLPGRSTDVAARSRR